MQQRTDTQIQRRRNTHALYNTTSITGARADSFVKVSRGGEENGIVGLSPPIGRCADRREERGSREEKEGGDEEVGEIGEIVAQCRQLEERREGRPGGKEGLSFHGSPIKTSSSPAAACLLEDWPCEGQTKSILQTWQHDHITVKHTHKHTHTQTQKTS